jgi:hypothetical protein
MRLKQVQVAELARAQMVMGRRKASYLAYLDSTVLAALSKAIDRSTVASCKPFAPF